MELIKDMLNDPLILQKYEKSRQVFIAAPADHGMKHINNIVKIADSFLKLFDLKKQEQLIIYTCLILHDIGTAYGRQGHQYKSRVFAEEYLKDKNIFSESELEEIYSVIETHDDYADLSTLKYDTSWFVNLIDKLDFSKDRLRDDYRNDFDRIIYDDIEKLDFEKDNKTLKIYIRPIPNAQMLSEDALFEKNLFNKSMKVFVGFCDHFGLLPEVYLDTKKLDLNKINFDAMSGR